MGRVTADTLLASSAPMMGRVTTDALMTSSEPPVGRVSGDALMTTSSIPHRVIVWCNITSAVWWNLECSFLCMWRAVQINVAVARLTAKRNRYLSHDYAAMMLNVYRTHVPALKIRGTRKGCRVQQENNIAYLPAAALHGGAPIQTKQNCATVWSARDLQPYVVQGALESDKNYVYNRYIHGSMLVSSDSNVAINMPLEQLCKKLTKPQLLTIAICHNMSNVNKHIRTASVHHCLITNAILALNILQNLFQSTKPKRR